MKRHSIIIFFSLCCLLGLITACNDDSNSLAPSGVLYLNVEEDQTLLTKATQEVTYESLQVVLLQEDDTIKVYNDYLTEVKGERLILPVGTYTVSVQSNHDGKAGWETPFYTGQETVEVKQGEITNAKVVCTIANTKVSVVYAEMMKEKFIDYQTTVSNESGELTYARDEYRAGFFTPEKLTVELYLKNLDGNTFTLKRVYPNIEPKYHYTFKFELSNDQGSEDDSEESEDAGLDFDLEIDTTHSVITYPIFITEEDLAYSGEPSLGVEGSFISGSYQHNVAQGEVAAGTIGVTFKLGSNNTVQSFKVTTDSPDFIEAGLSSFDLTNEQDAARAAVLGFPALSEASSLRADDLYNTYTLDLSPVVGHLSCVNNKPTLHNFSMELLDSKYQEATIDFSIRIMPDVEAYVNEPVTWSTFALLRGYCPSESSYFVVTLPDGSTKDLRNGITRDDEGNMLIMVTGLAAGTYQYEIKDDEDENIQTSLESFTIYDPTTGSYIVQNLGFDDWNTITTNKLSFSMGKNYMSPNATTDFTKVYWESGNYGASAIGEVLSQNTSDVATSDQKNTNAAYLKGTFAGLSGIMGAFSAGSVFIGKPTSVSTSGATLDYGRLHNGFPTKLSGYYKYTSGTIDYKKNEKETGGSDKAIIYIALSTRHFDELQSLMGSTIVRFDKTDASIIAYAELVVDKTVSTYTKFELPLIYREGKMPSYSNFVSEDGTPKIYITIVATSSIDGDEFTGSTSSELWIDEFSLDYSYNAESLVGTEYEKYTPVNINEVSVSTDNSGNTEENTENIENTENNETNE